MPLKIILQNYKYIDTTFPNPTTYEENSENAMTMPIHFFILQESITFCREDSSKYQWCLADFPTNSDILNYIYKV